MAISILPSVLSIDELTGISFCKHITLYEILVNISRKINLPPHNQKTLDLIGKISVEAANRFWKKHDEEIEFARKFSVSCAILNSFLHFHYPNPKNQKKYIELNWMSLINIRGENMRPIKEIKNNCSVGVDNILKEVIEILTYKIKWGNKTLNKYCDHFRESIHKGDKYLLSTRISNGKLTSRMGCMEKNLHNIGLELCEAKELFENELKFIIMRYQ